MPAFVSCDLLVIGAGPYGVATAAYAKSRGLDVIVCGKFMEFWKRSMPDGLILRSEEKWHLDVEQIHTFRRFLEEAGYTKEQITPIPVSVFLEYADWFRDRKKLAVRDCYVTELSGSEGAFQAKTDAGHAIGADRVVVAPGYRCFRKLPDDVVELLPEGSFKHTSDHKNFEELRGKRCLIIGGRQSAYESAALIAELPAEKVFISHRHKMPKFIPSDWSVLEEMAENTSNDPSWWRTLDQHARAEMVGRAIEAGRLRLEPWLWPRLQRWKVEVFEETTLENASRSSDGIQVRLSNGKEFEVDEVVLGTGYEVDVSKLGFLSPELKDGLRTENGVPCLDEGMQAAGVEGLYLVGMISAKEFSLVFGFTRGCPVAARIVVDSVCESLEV